MTDLRLALRSLIKNPGFSAVVVLTLALGIGANTAMFSVVEHTLLRPLPVPEPDQLVNLSSPGPKIGSTSANSGFGGTAEVFSYPLFRDLEGLQTVFTGIAAHRDFSANVAFRGRATHEAALLVSGSYFPVLGLQPALGRLLSPADDRVAGAHPVAVLSHEYWRNEFNADPAVLDQILIVNGQPMTIVGVTAADFVSTTIDYRPTLFVPLTMAALMKPDWSGFEDRRDHWLYLFARLTPGLSLGTAERTLSIPFARLINDVELPAQRGGLGQPAREAFARRSISLEPGSLGQRPDREDLARLALLLFCVTASVLLMACANVANLLVARGVSRASELSVRMSLGAGRARLVRQLLTESALLALLGGISGVLLAAWTLAAITPLIPGAGTFHVEFRPAIVMFTLLVSVGTVMLIGLYPAMHSTQPLLLAALRGGGTASPPASTVRFRLVLTTTQVALSLALLAVAGLFTKSFVNVGRLELGIRPESLITFRISPELNGYPRDRARLLVERVEQELLAIPGVSSVSTSTIPLLDGFGWSRNVTPDGGGDAQDARTADVGPAYFSTLGIPLMAGREFSESDHATAPKVAIVNESFVRMFDLGPNVLGRRIGLGAGDIPLDIEIVGVSRDARYSNLKSPPGAQFYLPYLQSQQFDAVNFYIRSSLATPSLLSMVPRLMNQIDRALPVENVRSMNDQVRAAAESDRSATILSAGFALLAVMLAAVGLYGVLSYGVLQRRREFGVRMALGATAWGITRLVFAQVASVSIVGGIAGSAVALGVGRLAQSLLFGVDGSDLGVIAVAAAVVASVCVSAAAFPARRAARVNPMTALRSE